MKDIKENLQAQEIVRSDSFIDWQGEDLLLEGVEEQLLSIMFILKTKYESSAEYSIIRSNLTGCIDKVNTLRRNLITGPTKVNEEKVEEKKE